MNLAKHILYYSTAIIGGILLGFFLTSFLPEVRTSSTRAIERSPYGWLVYDCTFHGTVSPETEWLGVITFGQEIDTMPWVSMSIDPETHEWVEERGDTELKTFFRPTREIGLRDDGVVVWREAK